MTFAEFIEAKGIDALAEKLEQKQGTVAVWKTRNNIPSAFWPKLMLAYPDEIDAAAILTMQDASRSVAA